MTATSVVSAAARRTRTTLTANRVMSAAHQFEESTVKDALLARIAERYDDIEQFGRAAWFSGFWHGMLLGFGIGALVILLVVGSG